MKPQEISANPNSGREYRTEYRISDARPRSVAIARIEERQQALRRLDARRRALHRDAHALVLEVTNGGVEHFPDWWYDLRRGKLRIYGSLLRFLDLASRRSPKWVLLMIPAWITAYIEDLYDVADMVKGA